MLYVMRHGQTDWNVQYRLQGTTDIPLNENGIKMAREAHDRFLETNIDICFCSPLTRARQTAELVLQGRNVSIKVDNRVIEACFGGYEGQERIYEKKDWPICNFFQNPEKYVADNGAESFEELFARAEDFTQNELVPRLKEGADILVVGHGAMNLALVNYIEGIPLKDYWSRFLQNCQLDEVDVSRIL